MSKPSEFPPVLDQTFVSHLIELRDRLLRGVIAVIVVFLGLFYFANDIYTFLAEPLLRHMPEGTSMIATEVASPFLTPFKLTLVLSVFIAIPYLLYQIWGFVAPALYVKEKRLVFPLLFSSTILFYVGMAFAYFVVFPLVFGFLTGVAPKGVAVMTDISHYLDFVLKMFFAFGLAFEVPIATILVIWTGLTTAENLASKRPYIVVGAFVVGMLLTPPDVISQTLLAVPMWLLFELGLLFSRMYTKDRVDEDSSEDEENDIAGGGGSPKAPAGSPTNSSKGNNPAATRKEPEFKHDDSPGLATHYSEGNEEYKELTEAEMDAELDRLDDDWDEKDQPHHEEFEPIEEERERKSKGDRENETSGHLSDVDSEVNIKKDDEDEEVIKKE